jgi:O-antigen/teichoic acid export membrane protein
VFLPRLAAARDAEFLDLLRRLQLIIVYVTVGPLSLLCVLAHSLPVVLFGPRWSPLGQLIPILSIAAFFGILGYIYYWAFLAKAKTMTLFLAEIGGRVPMAVLIVLLAPSGPQWVAAAVAFGQMLIWALSTFVFGRREGIPPLPMVATAVRPVLMFVLALAGGLAASSLLPSGAPILLLLFVSAAGWVVMAGLCLVLRPFRRDLATIRANIRPAR